jgi:hypothetical protein
MRWRSSRRGYAGYKRRVPLHSPPFLARLSLCPRGRVVCVHSESARRVGCVFRARVAMARLPRLTERAWPGWGGTVRARGAGGATPRPGLPRAGTERRCSALNCATHWLCFFPFWGFCVPIWLGLVVRYPVCDYSIHPLTHSQDTVSRRHGTTSRRGRVHTRAKRRRPRRPPPPRRRASRPWRRCLPTPQAHPPLRRPRRQPRRAGAACSGSGRCFLSGGAVSLWTAERRAQSRRAAAAAAARRSLYRPEQSAHGRLPAQIRAAPPPHS